MEYSGYESAFVPTEPSASENVERKTQKADNPTNTNESKKDADQKQIYEFSGQKNVLNFFRSYTYHFTLAALNKDQANNPSNYRDSELDLVILKSGGKGQEGISSKNVKSDIEVLDARDAKVKASREQKDNQNTADLIGGFNERSPGKFDLFIDNVEIETIMAFNAQGGTTQPVQFRFEVIEPYSINGFIEALHTSAVAAGYPSYASCSFLLKIEFWGYPDDDVLEFKDPIKVPKAERYFVFTFTGLEVEVTERGTKYSCSAIPFADKAYGQAGRLKKSIKMTGKNVREILRDLMKALNKQEAFSEEKSKGTGSEYDSYSIQFLKLSGGAWVDDSEGAIASSKLVEIGKDNSLYAMIDPAESPKPNAYQVDAVQKPLPERRSTKPETIQYRPETTVIQFPENSNLHDIIAAVIRDSEYTRDLIKELPIDSNGMIDYFIVRIEVKNKPTINPDTKKPYQEFTYIVTPYKVHYTNIPNFESQNVDEKKLKKTTLREYNYIYTGLNVDVRNFRLNFNNLYFEAIPADLGNKETPGGKTAARQGESVEIKTNPSSPGSPKQQIPSPAKRTDPTATAVKPPSGYNAGLPLNDPYSVLARSMHEKIINSVSLLTGELDIIGDPYYLVTGGIGNYNPGVANGQTTDGEAAHNAGQVNISINFRNPIDINSFEQGGMMRFDANRVPFSGVYMVKSVKSTFKDGLFLQKLDIIRIPGQIIDIDLEPSDPKDVLATNRNPSDGIKADTSEAVPLSQRADDNSVLEILNRGLPSSGVPGEGVNFVDAPGGLGGDSSALKNQTFGSFNRASSVFSGAGQVGLPLPNDIAANIRLTLSGLSDLSKVNFENSSKVTETIKTLAYGYNMFDTKSLQKSLTSSVLEAAGKVLSPGSGIGEGASYDLSSADSFVQNNISFTSRLSNISNSNISNASILDNSAGILNNATDKIAGLLGSISDPRAVASRAGIDPNLLSGLGQGLLSKSVNQLESFSDLPENVNLTQSRFEGLILNNMSPSKLKNIPATQPYVQAPPPDNDPEFLNYVASTGGENSLARSFGVNNIKNIPGHLVDRDYLSDALANVPTGQRNPLSNINAYTNSVDINAYTDRVQSSNSQINPLTRTRSVPDQYISGSVTDSLGSLSAGKNPLNKLINKKNLQNPKLG